MSYRYVLLFSISSPVYCKDLLLVLIALAAVAMDVASKQVQSSIFASSPFSSSSSSSSTRRRDRSEGNLDDLLNAITNKLGNADIQDSKSQLVAAFVEVMQCSDMEADFYLESSNMDIATAISLCMDAREDMERDQNMFRRNNANSSTGKRHRSLSDAQGYNVKYNGKQIYIAGMHDFMYFCLYLLYMFLFTPLNVFVLQIFLLIG